MSMNVLVTGGGSGGHMYPALAIAEKFKEKGYSVYYVGGDQLEHSMWPKDEFPYLYIHSMGREFGGVKELIQIALRNLKGLNEAKKLIKKYKPVCVIGTGGYVEVPLILAAHLLKVPSFIQEQNAIPGRANLFLEKFVEKVFLGFDEARSDFKNSEKILFSGNPVRDLFNKKNKTDSRKKLGYTDDEFIILLTGGSLGAPKINEVAIELAKHVEEMDNVRMVLSTGQRYYEKISNIFKENNINTGRDTRIEVYPYINDMADYLASSDFVIERSGAVSVAETIAKGIPSLMIPSTYVYKNHQFYNAKVVYDNGACILLEEKDLKIEDAVNKVLHVIKDKDYLNGMSQKARALYKEDTLDYIFLNVEKVINDRNKRR